MYGNRYFKVSKATTVWILSGWKSTNCYYGRSEFFSATYTEVTAKRGDEIHKLCGGTFLVRKTGEVSEARFYKPIEKSPFEKTYGGYVEPKLPETLSEIDEKKARKVDNYRGEK